MAKAADPDAEITDTEWRGLLQQQHPLLGAYDWRTDPAAASSSDAEAQAQGQQQHQRQGEHVDDSAPVQHLTAGAGGGDPGSWPHDDTVDRQQQQQQQQQDDDVGNMDLAPAAVSEGGFGGRAARLAWEQKNEGLVEAADAVGELRPPVDAPRLSEEDLAFIAEYEGSMGLDSSQQQEQQRSWQQQWNQLDPARQVEMQQQWHQQWQKQQEQRQQEKQQWEDMQLSQQQHDQQEPHQHQHSHQQQQQQQAHEQQHDRQQQEAPRRPRPGHRRLWRWLRTPSTDWLAADWSFSDESEGVLVLRMMQEGAVVAVGVRDESQPNKPIKVRKQAGVFDMLPVNLTGVCVGVGDAGVQPDAEWQQRVHNCALQGCAVCRPGSSSPQLPLVAVEAINQRQTSCVCVAGVC
jgi:hypothetical protein